MRILMIGTNRSAMQTDILHNVVQSACVHRQITSEVEFKDGTCIKYTVIRDTHDIEKLRGLRFDMIIEHGSFRGPYEALQMVRAIVLR